MKNQTFLLAATLLGVSLTSSQGQIGPYDLMNKGQEKNEWCWNACSQMILHWKGFSFKPGYPAWTTDQTTMAQYGVNGFNQPNLLFTGPHGMGPFQDEFSGQTYYRMGINQVLSFFSGETIPASRPHKFYKSAGWLSWAQLKIELGNGRPFIYAITWYNDALTKIIGGHVGVAKAYWEYGNTKAVAIEDPWPLDGSPAFGKKGYSTVVAYEVLSKSSNTVIPDSSYSKLVSNGNTKGHWSDTLLLRKSLDVAFMFNSTAANKGAIDAMKANAAAIIGSLKAKSGDLRVAVVEYRNNPETSGVPTDFITKVRTPFTEDTAAAETALLAIEADGENGPAEAVCSAVFATTAGNEIGFWREGEDVDRQIFLIGGAPALSPEPWADGRTMDSCLGLLQGMGTEGKWDDATGVSLQSVLLGDNSEAAEDFETLASDSGGTTVKAGTDADVPVLIEKLIEDVDGDRFPVDTTTAMEPVFFFKPPGGEIPSAAEISGLAVEVQTLDQRRDVWRSFRRFNLPDTNDESLASERYFPPGRYRWRLNVREVSTNFVLPNGSKVKDTGAQRLVEETWTEFQREPAIPGPVTKITPALIPLAGKVELVFEDEVLSDSFAIRLLLSGNKQRTFLLKRSQLQSGTGTLKAVLVNPQAGASWEIQGLNRDRNKISPTAWN